MLALASRHPSVMGRFGLLVVPLVLAGLLGACESNVATAPRPNLSNAGNGPNGKNAPVRITPESDTLNALYDTLLLAANVDVTWTSLSPTVATVDATGRVVSVGSGLGLIRALGVGGRKADTAEVLVRQLLASVQVTPDSLTLEQGSQDTLTAVAADANGYPIIDAIVTWVSDAIEIATVLEGIVMGVDTGATAVRASVNGVSDTATVRVIAPPANPYP
jgi:uncharacterized protein YjdB